MLFRFLATRQPQPGTMALGFDKPFSDPVFEVQGPGVAVLWDWRPLQPPQQYYNMAVPHAGIPTVAGQIFGQPLLNPGGS